MGNAVTGFSQLQTPAGWAVYAELQVQKGLGPEAVDNMLSSVVPTSSSLPESHISC